MRILRALFIPLVTIVVIALLDRPLGPLPALGRLLDPVNGWAANAEPVSEDFNRQFSLEGVKQPVTIWIEDRMVPHVRAANDHDLYFTQGYLHAFFRLWQMDFQTRAAAGRISEVVGEKWVTDEKTGTRRNAVLAFDRAQRRKGMVYAAERSLKAMEAEPHTKEMLDAYTAGVNSYIASAGFRDLPIEYKLMDFKPEPWTNLKCALLLKYMADDLTGYTEDIPLSMLRDRLPAEEFAYLFPQRLKDSKPVIPEGVHYDPPSLAVPQAPGDSIWAHFDVTAHSAHNAGEAQPDPRPEGIGSNSWAISGVRTASGAPMLCNDPHLGLNLPSLWFELQLQAPGLNVYGVSLPGAPGVVIGFNDSLSWGLTNNYRDVKDFYEIEAIDRDFYRFDGRQQPFDKRTEVIRIKGKPDFVDTVFYTVHGPVMYDEAFEDPSRSGKKLAMTWMAHRPTNELLSLYLLNRAKNYIEFTEAIMSFQCPAQNMVYADRAGNIAMWGQGQFINKWKDQGRYVMKGNTSAALWGADIPMTENPHVLNPEQGFLASANQVTTDSTYPYWYNGYFYDFRAWRINAILSGQAASSARSNMSMQNDVVSYLARNAVPRLDRLIYGDNANTSAKDSWDYALTPESNTATRFQLMWNLFYEKLWQKDFSFAGLYPSPERTMQLLISDSSSGRFFNKIRDAAQQGASESMDSLEKIRKATGSSEWYKVKGSQLTHLAKLDAFSYKDLKIGGWGNTINAVKKTHGPSWRMIVELGKDAIRAYGVYPGGQSGNPGSKYYGTFIDNWVEGRYYDLAFLPGHGGPRPGNIKYTWTIKP